MHFLGIDGTDVPFWTRQIGAPKGSLLDQRLRKRVPNADYREYTRTAGGGKAYLEKNGQASTDRVSASWRGGYGVALTCLITGLPLVWALIPAGWDEASAMEDLLRILYRLWPDCPATHIVGDSAYDEERWCRIAEQNYGLHPVFRIHDEEKVPQIKAGDHRYDAVKEIGPEGQLVCNQPGCGLTASFASADVGKRWTLADDGVTKLPIPPGQPADGDYRVSARCPKHGEIGLRMEICWRRLTYLPHYARGAEERFALRTVLLARLKQHESVWSRMKVAKKIGCEGQVRTRLWDWDVVACLMSLALMSMTAYAFTDQQIKRGRLPSTNPVNPDDVEAVFANNEPGDSQPAADDDAATAGAGEPGPQPPAAAQADPADDAGASVTPGGGGAPVVRIKVPPPLPEPTLPGHMVCPSCAEEVREQARVCRYCRHEFYDLGTTALVGGRK